VVAYCGGLPHSLYISRIIMYPIHCPGYATSYISRVRITTVYLYFTYNNSIRDSIKERERAGGIHQGGERERERERERARERERL